MPNIDPLSRGQIVWFLIDNCNMLSIIVYNFHALQRFFGIYMIILLARPLIEIIYQFYSTVSLHAFGLNLSCMLNLVVNVRNAY